MTVKQFFTKTPSYKSNYIPKDAKVFIGCDFSKDGDCTVKGFRDIDGVMHIQEVEFSQK